MKVSLWKYSVSPPITTTITAENICSADTRRVSAPVRDRVAALTAATRELDAAGVAVEDVALRRPTLDEVFLHLTGHDTEAATERPQEVTA